MLKSFFKENQIELGIDESGRGCLAGPVFIGGVIWNPEIDPLNIKDSKKLSKKKREELFEYITENAIDWCVIQVDNDEIDNDNILNCTINGMHKVINSINVDIDRILVDGNRFKIYRKKNGSIIPHICVIGGDNKYISIAAASILAKVSHDKYIENLVKEYPKLEVYNWQKNMCYGTKDHINAIKEFGITKYHRKSFGICNNCDLFNVI